jgi:putative hydrolase of the HAD superfamily
LWDAELCSEAAGALKPASAGFNALAAGLGVPADQILYVGNSYRFDVLGAAAAGMKTALRVNRIPQTRRFTPVQPDILFTNYPDLRTAIDLLAL